MENKNGVTEYLCEVYVDKDGNEVVGRVEIKKETAKQYQVEETMIHRSRIYKVELGEVVDGVAAHIRGQYMTIHYVLCLPEDVEKAKKAIRKAVVEELKEEKEQLKKKEEFYREYLLS